MTKSRQLRLDLGGAMMSTILLNLATQHHPASWMVWCAALGGVLAVEWLLVEDFRKPCRV